MAPSTAAAASTRRLTTLFTASVRLSPSTCASSSRTFASTSTARLPILTTRPIPAPRPSLSTPVEFLTSISKPRRDLAANSSAVTALGEDWASIFSVKTTDLKKAGLGPKDRKYLLWAIEKLRQGESPEQFAYAPKPKKKVRGWGPRVQTAERIRVRGRKRPGEK